MEQKVAIVLDKKTVQDLDRWVGEGRYPNRSRALEAALDLLSERELAKLDKREEQRMAEE